MLLNTLVSGTACNQKMQNKNYSYRHGPHLHMLSNMMPAALLWQACRGSAAGITDALHVLSVTTTYPSDYVHSWLPTLIRLDTLSVIITRMY